MAQRFKSWVADKIGQNLILPQNSFFGRLAMGKMVRNNRFLEHNAVKMCKIQPDYKVLEIGFGPGLGLQSAYNIVKEGKGVVYGIDTSMFMVDVASKRLRRAIQNKKVLLFHGTAAQIPLNTDTLHRVFHCNCYYFWPSMRPVMREIHRVMRPGSIMITALNLDQIAKFQAQRFLEYGRPDPVRYMACLENYGFEGVHLEYHTDECSGKTYQVIFAEVREKPAHDQSMLSDDEDDSRDEFFLRDKKDYDEILKGGIKTNPRLS